MGAGHDDNIYILSGRGRAALFRRPRPAIFPEHEPFFFFLGSPFQKEPNGENGEGRRGDGDGGGGTRWRTPRQGRRAGRPNLGAADGA